MGDTLREGERKRAGLHENLMRLFDLRLFKFSLVGIASTAISFVVFNIAYAVTAKLPLSIVLSILAGAINGIYGHRRWTFHDRRSEAAWKQAARFLLVTASSCLVSTLASSAVVAWWPFGPAWDGNTRERTFLMLASGAAKHKFGVLEVNIGAAVGGLLSLGLSYTLSNLWAFRHGTSAQEKSR